MSYLDLREVERGMYDVFVDPALDMQEVIKATAVPNLSVAPARISLAKLESRLVGELDAPFRLKDQLAKLAAYTHIVIDCPPALGLLTVNALVAATHLLIPIQSSYFALEGTDDLLETIEKVRQRPNPGLKILGVVITMHDRGRPSAGTSSRRSARCSEKRCSRRSSARAFGSRKVRRIGSPSSRSRPSHRGERVLQPVRRGHRTCLNHAVFQSLSRCATTRTTSTPSRLRRPRRWAAWCRSTWSIRTPTSLGRPWVTCRTWSLADREGHHRAPDRPAAW
jgi:hypothetical protein